ncbi:MAG: hypothetical protein WKF96_14685 [Solirubrobacteraceae bacterium]
MVVSDAQLSFVAAPRVVVEYDPWRAPPSATGPFELGVYAAYLDDMPCVPGWGASEPEALGALANRLGELAEQISGTPGLGQSDQALAAAAAKTPDALCDWLAAHATPAVLCARDERSLPAPAAS